MIKKSWWIDFRANHTRHRKRSPENSRTGALAYEAMLRQKLARGESMDRAERKDPVFEKFAAKWFEDYVIPNNKPSEQKHKKYVLSASLVPFFGKMLVGQITSYHVDQYKAQLVKEGIANKTIKNRLTILNKCLITAYEWLQLEGTPPKIKWPKCAPPHMRYLSPDECELFLSHTEGVIHEMILTALRTGMRQGEIRGLQWSSIDWERRELTVRHSLCDIAKALVPPKSNRERYIPLDSDVYEALYERKKSTGYVFLDADGKPFDHKRAGRRLTKIRKSVGLDKEKIGWHTFRHTFASRLVTKGVQLNRVQALLGHSSILTTMRYAHLAPTDLREAIDTLNPRHVLNESFGQPVGNQWIQKQKQEIVEKIAVAKKL
ncbi:hypothetical protein A2704_05685 [Candidatus Kaiserbacteria bacterium RIFCSPHIGHO2_01_FULL_54_36b]|uniref:Tyr recombinase domain-containing protein n=1 Tax=Candidatus Kaiserbacteria bacterium RIFCSPHIGHO2_01_FULL_54_36b TaxID=1798483 RepID=A0A1F6CMC7_9BACT|nr:MAG: hypothetical protein A2704_05685 [Candidatus Kaiserbacteria bacterium RIFCSPHIGHO2_01_FULL_54_36b]